VDRPAQHGAGDGVAAPVVHAAVPFDNAAEAHRILSARENVGKVVLVP
jgi:NADPH:quinone reductase-like Zn-dependent oxidoreductase